jgi:hypothetical protein
MSLENIELDFVHQPALPRVIDMSGYLHVRQNLGRAILRRRSDLDGVLDLSLESALLGIAFNGNVRTRTLGSKLRLSATLDDKGNLEVLGMATSDLRPGFRYVIATVSREGIKTVNGKMLPKE